MSGGWWVVEVYWVWVFFGLERVVLVVAIPLAWRMRINVYCTMHNAYIMCYALYVMHYMSCTMGLHVYLSIVYLPVPVTYRPSVGTLF